MQKPLTENKQRAANKKFQQKPKAGNIDKLLAQWRQYISRFNISDNRRRAWKHLYSV